MKFEKLSDFEKLSFVSNSLEDIKSYILEESFFNCPQSDFAHQQKHSAFVDKILGYKIDQLELSLVRRAKELYPFGTMKNWGRLMHNGSQSWVGLTPQQLQTTYNELWRMCEILNPKPHSSFVDIGAGYGRMALVLNLFSPDAHFVGYEIVKERVEEGNRMFEFLGLHDAKLLLQDIAEDGFTLPQADYYFMYDFGNSDHINIILNQLKVLADHRTIRVVVRGDYSRHEVQNFHPWLSQVFEAHHEEKFSVYSSGSLIP